MKMSEEQLAAIIDNEKEWRKTMYKELQGTRQELHDFKVEMTNITTTLKVKIGFVGAFFGLMGGAAVSLIAALIK